MFISDPIKAFGLNEQQAKDFAQKLSLAAIARENSYTETLNHIGTHYSKSYLAAANGDEIIAEALRISWNECMDFIKSQGFDLPNT